ncbi:MAG: hypothetical protein JWO42_3763 [Chloroflexi bacterium]|nr:hypothetical protein [Chloroflexota bacterium]
MSVRSKLGACTEAMEDAFAAGRDGIDALGQAAKPDLAVRLIGGHLDQMLERATQAPDCKRVTGAHMSQARRDPADPPLTVSVQILLQPLACRASRCSARVWSWLEMRT